MATTASGLVLPFTKLKPNSESNHFSDDTRMQTNYSTNRMSYHLFASRSNQHRFSVSLPQSHTPHSDIVLQNSVQSSTIVVHFTFPPRLFVPSPMSHSLFLHLVE